MQRSLMLAGRSGGSALFGRVPQLQRACTFRSGRAFGRRLATTQARRGLSELLSLSEKCVWARGGERGICGALWGLPAGAAGAGRSALWETRRRAALQGAAAALLSPPRPCAAALPSPSPHPAARPPARCRPKGGREPLRAGTVSPMQEVPSHIPRPPYADKGNMPDWDPKPQARPGGAGAAGWWRRRRRCWVQRGRPAGRRRGCQGSQRLPANLLQQHNQ